MSFIDPDYVPTSPAYGTPERSRSPSPVPQRGLSATKDRCRSRSPSPVSDDDVPIACVICDRDNHITMMPCGIHYSCVDCQMDKMNDICLNILPDADPDDDDYVRLRAEVGDQCPDCYEHN
jgi:hypothetical protein